MWLDVERSSAWAILVGNDEAVEIRKMASPSTTAELFTLNFLTTAVLPFSLAYFPMRTRSSGVNNVVYLCLAFLHSLLTARLLSLPGSPLEVHWATAAFGLPLVGSWLVENTDVDSWY